MSHAGRHIWLCADDYGITRPVNGAIRDLLARGRINATSVMVVASACAGDEAAALNDLKRNGRAAIGLHLTLTAPFVPLSRDYAPLHEGAFLPLTAMLRTAMARRLNRESLACEVAAQLQAFRDIFGAPPDFVDGHQHVHLFPQIRDAVLDAVARTVPDAWVRQCGRITPLHGRLRDPKGLLLDVLSVTFRRHATRLAVRTNPAFAGTYDFTSAPEVANVFPPFFEGLPEGGLVMCHPGVVDGELERLDPLTTQREREYAYLSGDVFPRMLAARGLTLAR